MALGRGWEWTGGTGCGFYGVGEYFWGGEMFVSGARVAESGTVAAVGACQVLSPLLKRRAREQARLVWPGSGTGGCWLWIIWCWGVLLKL